MSVAEELTFHLEDFDGPLELLLALVAKHKMDLHNIPILELIDQYTATVARADPDPEAASACCRRLRARRVRAEALQAVRALVVPVRAAPARVVILVQAAAALAAPRVRAAEALPATAHPVYGSPRLPSVPIT